MGVLGLFTTTGTAISLGLGWVVLKRSQRNRKRIINLEQKIGTLRNFEVDTLQQLRQLLNGLDKQLGDNYDDSQPGQPENISALREQLRALRDSVSTTSEDRTIDGRASKWLYNNRAMVARNAAEITLRGKSDYSKHIDAFAVELASCLSMTAQMIDIDHPGALSKVWNNFPREALPTSFYVLALQEVINLTQCESMLISEEKAKIKSYLETLLSYNNNSKS